LLLTPKVPARPPEQASGVSHPSLSGAGTDGTTNPSPRRRPRAGLWVAVAVVAGLSLAIGAGAFSPGHSQPASLYQRTLEVAGQYRCPVCASESVAVSDAAEAVEIRALIEGWLKKGDSQAQIRGYLVSDYGSSILEKPPASGLDTLVWVLPALAAAFGIAGLGFGFARWRRAGASGPVHAAVALLVGADLRPEAGSRPAEEHAPSAPGGPQAASEPVPDAGSELRPEAGPGARPLEVAALAATMPVQERLFEVAEDERPAPALLGAPDVPPRPLYRRVAPVLGAVLVLAAGALWLVDRTSSQRLPGGTVSGGVTGVDEELQQAASLASSDPAAALALYDEVLVSDPNQPVALSGEGWIYAEAGYVAKGEGLLQKAEADDPSFDPPHLYRGLVLLEDQRKPAAAIKELKWYLAHGPDPALTKTAKTALAQAEARL